MEISSFSRMRSYRNGAHTSAILKLVLPRDADAENEAFNSFYASLAECYSELAEHISQDMPSGASPAVVSVDFEVLVDAPEINREENLITIKRTHRVRCGAKSSVGSFVDCFDMSRKIFIK